MYSQNSEEHYILEHFKGKTDGRFLDCGAFSGKIFSNTFALVEQGWSGVEIEPSPAAFMGLMQNLKPYPSVKLVNAAMSYNGAGLIEFADSGGDAVSTTNPSHEAVWAKHLEFQHIYVNTINIREIIRVFGEHYDFISLDVEGTNLEILKTFPLDIMNPSLICVEHENKFEEIFAYCTGYSEIHRNGENLILKKA
jgi:FkbM family methyltransferase